MVATPRARTGSSGLSAARGRSDVLPKCGAAGGDTPSFPRTAERRRVRPPIRRTDSAPSAAQPTCPGSMTRGRATIQAASAIATCGSSASTCGPPRSSEVTMAGSAALRTKPSARRTQQRVLSRRPWRVRRQNGRSCPYQRGAGDAAAQALLQVDIAKGHVGARKEHHQPEADLGQKRECGVGGVQVSRPSPPGLPACTESRSSWSLPAVGSSSVPSMRPTGSPYPKPGRRAVRAHFSMSQRTHLRAHI